MNERNEKNDYRRPSIKSMKAGEVVAAMGPAHAIYGSASGGSQGDGGGLIGN